MALQKDYSLEEVIASCLLSDNEKHDEITSEDSTNDGETSDIYN